MDPSNIDKSGLQTTVEKVPNYNVSITQHAMKMNDIN